MDSGTASPKSHWLAWMEALPAKVRQDLSEIYAEVDTLNRDQMAAITSQEFERAAELPARAAKIKQRLVKIIRQAGLREGDIPPYPG